MQRHLVKTVNFYSDGTYEEILIEEQFPDSSCLIDKINRIFNSPACSCRIIYNVALYTVAKHLIDYENKSNLKEIISDAFNYTITTQNITYSSISDATSRQLEMSKSEYKDLLAKALQGNPILLKQKLKKHLGKGCEYFDANLIDMFIHE